MPPANNETARKPRKVRQGIVVSDKLSQSIVVRVNRTLRHPLYKKVIRRSKKYMAHDHDDTGKVGDVVRIMECRPFSRHKRWRLVEVLRRAEDMDVKLQTETTEDEQEEVAGLSEPEANGPPNAAAPPDAPAGTEEVTP